MKIIAFDLDDVLCCRDKKYEKLGVDKYQYCVPIQENIDLMNQCHDNGYYIKIYTARGMTQFNGDYKKIIEQLYQPTYDQLISWKAKFHELIFGKTHYDILIDDKVSNIKDVKTLDDIIKCLNEF